jgi:hypothetical protein
MTTREVGFLIDRSVGSCDCFPVSRYKTDSSGHVLVVGRTTVNGSAVKGNVVAKVACKGCCKGRIDLHFLNVRS